MDALEAGIISLIQAQPFYASLLMQMRRMAAPGRVALAGVRFADGGMDLLYDPEGMGRLNARELLGVLEHECLHLVLRHFERRGGRDQVVLVGLEVCSLWNVATDLAVNSLIARELPRDVLRPAHFRLAEKLSAEEYYDKLLARLPRAKDKGPGAVAAVPGLAVAGDEERRRAQGRFPRVIDDHGFWGEGDEVADLRQETVRRMVATAREASPGRGTLPGFLEETVDAWLVPPTVHWARILRMFVGTAARAGHRTTWMRPSRRFGEEQKGRVALRRLHLAVAIDTSGSISTEQLCLFAAEVRNLAASYRSAVTVLECDAQVQKVYPLRGLQVDMRFKGRGGTDFNPVFDHLREERVPANVLIFLTDLYGAFPGRAPPYPVLWVVPPGSAGERVPFGRKIVLDADSRGGGR